MVEKGTDRCYPRRGGFRLPTRLVIDAALPGSRPDALLVADHERRDGPRAGTYGLEDVFLKLIEDLRQQLKEGIPDKNIPPLDPLDMKHQTVDLKYKDDFK